MVESSTAWIQTALDQFLDGDSAAKAELVQFSEQRLRELVPKLFGKSSPNSEATSELISAGYVKFQTSLAVVRPHTSRQFFSLTYLQMKRVFYSLMRADNPNWASMSVGETIAMDKEPNLPTPSQRLAELLEAVETLDDLSKEAVIMVYFHGLSETEASVVLGQDAEKLKLHWARAQAVLGSRLPALSPD